MPNPTAHEIASTLLELAEKATPGVWVYATYSKKFFGLAQAGGTPFFMLQCRDDTTESLSAQNDAAYIASCSPERVKLLAETVLSQERRLEEAEGLLNATFGIQGVLDSMPLTWVNQRNKWLAGGRER